MILRGQKGRKWTFGDEGTDERAVRRKMTRELTKEPLEGRCQGKVIHHSLSVLPIFWSNSLSICSFLSLTPYTFSPPQKPPWSICNWIRVTHHVLSSLAPFFPLTHFSFSFFHLSAHFFLTLLYVFSLSLSLTSDLSVLSKRKRERKILVTLSVSNIRKNGLKRYARSECYLKGKTIRMRWINQSIGSFDEGMERKKTEKRQIDRDRGIKER